MPRQAQLTEFEKGQIDELKKQNLNGREIAKRINKSQSMVSRYLKNPIEYGKRFCGGRPSKLSERTRRQIINEAAKTGSSANSLRESLSLNVSKSTIIRCLNSTSLFKYQKANQAPKLTQVLMNRRANWAEKMVEYGSENWNRIIFSDEKKWNLDGPDGHKYYWHCLRNDPRVVFSRQNGGGSLMVWGGIWSDGTTKLAFLDGNQNSNSYIYTLSEYLLPAANLRFGTEYVFQQDNASIHTANLTKDFFVEHDINVLDWPALSPDLNPIENLDIEMLWKLE